MTRDLYPDLSERNVYYFREPDTSVYGRDVDETLPPEDMQPDWKDYNPPEYKKFESVFPLRADRFILQIDAYDKISYHVTKISTGNVFLPRVEVPDLNIYMGVGATKIKTENLKLTFVVDSELKNYNTILEWMKEAVRGFYSHLIIWCYDSCDDNKLVGYFSYKKAFPVFLSSLEFTTGSNDLLAEPQTVFATMELSIDKQEVVLLDYKPFNTPPSV